MSIKKSNICRSLLPLMESTANGEGSPKEREAVEAHIAVCSNCRTEYQHWKTTVALTANWRLSEVPESRRDWNDLHARLTAPKPQPLRPVFPLVRMGLGGLVGAAAIMAVWLFLPPSFKEENRGTGEQGENFVAVQDAPTAQMPPTEKLDPVPSTETIPIEKPNEASHRSYGRTFAAIPPPKTKLERPAVILVKHQEPNVVLPRKKQSPTKIGEAGRQIAQHASKPKLETSRRIPLNIDGEASVPDLSHEYALGAVPSGQSAGIQLTPASYSSPSEKTAW